VSKLHIDFETRSAVDLKKTGVYVYAEDPTTDVWCAAFAVDDGPVELWTPGMPVPDAIFDAVVNGWPIVAHNANFEQAIWHGVLAPRYGWPVPHPTQWRCTMAMALAMSLPGSLDNAAAALGLDTRKDVKGYGIMMRMAKPRKVNADGSIVWWDEPHRLAELYAYCKQDVEVERQLEKRLVQLSPSELDLWHLDQTINARGVYVDERLCLAAKAIVAQTQARLDVEMKTVTDYGVSACSNAVQLAQWVRAKGFPADSIAKDQIEILLARDDLPEDVRRALELRREAAKASVAKIDSLLAGMQRDKRSRGLLQYHAASTGRWGGRRFQPQNIKRPKLKNVDLAIEAVLHGDVDVIDMMYGEPLSVVGDCLRGMIRAAPGNKLMAADYANIEGRVLAWLAGEEWKLQAFRAFDAGAGPDLYKVAYAKTFGIKIENVDSFMRSIGKVLELAPGFQGGAGAFLMMANVYGVNLADIFEIASTAAGRAVQKKASEAWAQRGVNSGHSEAAWTTGEMLKIMWRNDHPKTVEFWWALDEAAIEAVQNPGLVITCGKVRMVVRGSFLWLRLPSGRALCYPYPKLVMKDMPWEDGEGKPARKQVFSYKGVDSYTRKWTDCYAYGGLWAENVTQAVARDLMAEGVKRLEAADYPVILTVHDEIVSEVPAGFGSVDEFCALMTELPAWAAGCPVTAEGFSAERYRK
jgi:DNA polymerase bacteriophage-type